MKPGIFYLYEYNHSQKLRNAGFLKVTRYYQSCTLMLNARGIPVSYSDTIKLCAFYLEHDLANSVVLAEIPCANHAFSARLDSAESYFPDGRTLDRIDGFFLPLSNGHVLAAAAPGIAVDARKLLAVSSEPAKSENEPAKPENESAKETSREPAASEETPPDPGSADSLPSEPDRTEPSDDGITEEAPEPGQEIPAETSVALEAESVHACGAPQQEAQDEPEALPQQEAQDEPETLPQQEAQVEPETLPQQEAQVEPETLPQQEAQVEPECEPEQKSSEEHAAQGQAIKKIRRSEMSVLPRRYWHLANNSFLLHGYHNYHHLILIEKDGHYWLGVPGIYDSHEARAARLFGFPQFTDSYNDSLQLADDECNPQEKFGYWCCFLK